MPIQSDLYFASLSADQGYLDALIDKLNTYRQFIQTTGLEARWRLSYCAYYGVSPDGKSSWQVNPGGEFGELVQLKVNDYASLVRHELVLAVKDRPAGIARAINTDPKTLRDARVGSLLVEYYLTDPSKHFVRDYIKAMELGLMTSEAFIVQDWDPNAGELVRPDVDEEGQDTGEDHFNGDLKQKVYPTWNTARDVGAPSPEQPWYIFSERVNKWELIAQYPAHKDAILRYSKGSKVSGAMFQPWDVQTDFVEVHKFVHMPTVALKEGRYTLFIEDEILLDSAYPYKTKNFHRVADRDMFETAFGHTSNYDLLGLEQVTDALHSIAINNQTTFGVATIVGPKGGGIAHQELAAGLRYLELDPAHVDKIRPLQLTSTPVELFNYLQMLGTKKGELSGINSILRGDPSGALKGASGSALALLQSQAITFNSGIQEAFYALLTSAGSGIIELLREFADEPRVVRIAGKSNAQAVKEYKFSSKTLESISTIIFEPVNPVLQTAAGKLSLADNLLQAGMIKSPKRYIEVLTTGNLNVLIEDDVRNEELILQENEQLSEGMQVKAIITEHHRDHIKGHQAVLSTPEAKRDPMLVQNTLAHIQEHLDLWRQASDTNPALLVATGQEVLPPVPQPNVPPPPQGPPGPGPAAAANMQSGDPNQPNLPKMPVNPATGERPPAPPGTPVSN